MPNNYIIATIKSWNVKNFYDFKKQDKKNQWFIVDKKENLTLSYIQKIQPRYIFFPHWSWIIPKSIWSNFECVVFHMTDLPYGRGGTPLQNLILHGHKNTKISALKVAGGIDEGNIYIKQSLILNGSAEEIYKRASKIIFTKMIPYIIKNDPKPKKQKGKVVTFKRREPEQSKIPKCKNIEELYDFIRMLDAEGYPRAFIEYQGFILEFSHPKLLKDNIFTSVKIKKDGKSGKK